MDLFCLRLFRMKTIYLHLGLPKTATSFLQGAVFPSLKEVDFLDKTERGTGGFGSTGEREFK